jgi:hypothetical protein
MKQKLKTEAGRELYRMRKAIVEPVFGQIKEWRGFRQSGAWHQSGTGPKLRVVSLLWVLCCCQILLQVI